MYTVSEFCEFVRISRRYFGMLRKAGDGPTITQLGKRVLVSHEDAEAWLKSRRVPNPPKTA